MRHQDQRPTIRRGDAGQAVLGAIGIGGVGFAHSMVCVDVLRRDQAGRGQLPKIARIREFGAALAMGHRHRQDAAGHAGQPRRGAWVDPHEHGAPFELLGAIAHESRPGLGTGNQRLEMGHHLAAVADAERQSVRGKIASERIAHRAVMENALRPAAAAAEHIAVGKTAAGGQHREVEQRHGPGNQLRHVDIHRCESSPVEGRRHFEVAVDALLAQHRHPGPGSANGEGRRRLARVKSQFGRQAWIGIADAGVLFVRRLGIVAQALHSVARLGPPALPSGPLRVNHHGVPVVDAQPLVRTHGAQVNHPCPGIPICGLNPSHLRIGHLHHPAQLFRKERGEQVLVGNADLPTEAPGERHFRQRGQEPAIGTVVIGQQRTGPIERCGRSQRACQHRRIIHVGTLIPQLTVTLGQCAAAETRPSPGQFHQKQPGGRALQHWRERPPRINDRRKGRHDQGHRRDDAALDILLLPAGGHGQAVLADRNGDAKRWTKIKTHRTHRIEQRLLLRVPARRRHPVGGQHHPVQRFNVRREEIGQRLPNG